MLPSTVRSGELREGNILESIGDVNKTFREDNDCAFIVVQLSVSCSEIDTACSDHFWRSGGN
jgi:hypothetical protein